VATSINAAGKVSLAHAIPYTLHFAIGYSTFAIQTLSAGFRRTSLRGSMAPGTALRFLIETIVRKL